MNKIIYYDAFENVRAVIQNKTIVLVGGCFDIFHYGHLIFLQEARKHGDMLIVALESDEFIINKKKRNPIHSQKQRAEILSVFEIIDLVILLPYFSKDEEYDNLVEKIKPQFIAVTEGDSKSEQKKQQAKRVNAQFVEVNKLIPEFSSSQILNQ
jgi:cytidyltransferase-like protein